MCHYFFSKNSQWRINQNGEIFHTFFEMFFFGLKYMRPFFTFMDFVL
jgi:hypothetical protein